MSSAALSEYRNIVRLLFRVVDPDHYKSKDLDALLDRIHDILQTSDHAKPLPMIPLSFMEEAIRPPTPPTLIIHPDQKVEEVVPNVIVTKSEPETKTVSVQEKTLTPQNIVVTSSKVDAAIFRVIAKDDESESDSDSFAEDSEAEESDAEDSEAEESDAEDSEAEESDAEEEAESDAEESDAEESEAEESEAEESEAEEETAESEEEEEAEEYDEERDGEMELVKIKKERYWVTAKNQKVFTYADGAYGDCIGVFKDGKIESPN